MELILDSVRKSRLHQLQRMLHPLILMGRKCRILFVNVWNRGPLDEDEIPFGWIKVSGLMTNLKLMVKCV